MVVFGTNLQPESWPLAQVAGLLAARLGVPLRLVHVAEDPRAPLVLGTDEAHLLGAVRSELEVLAQRLAAATGASVYAHLAAGTVPGALVDIARFELATLLVVGTGGGLPLVGDTAERVARKSPVPVLALREVAPLRAWLLGEHTLRILVAADSGQAATAARALAVRLAGLGPCVTEVAMVASPIEVHERLGLPQPTDLHALSAEVEGVLRRDLERSAPPGEGATLHLIAARGAADAHLVARVDQGDFDLVLVGQRRQSLVEQLWYGSVARGVLRSAPVSVACVPPPLAGLPAVPRPPREVLVALDFSEVSDYALALAQALEAHLHLVHVRADHESQEPAWHGLAKRLERVPGSQPHLLVGEPAVQILALADRLGVDLIVLGTRGRSVVDRWVLGSVAQSLSARSPVPILLVPPPSP